MAHMTTVRCAAMRIRLSRPRDHLRARRRMQLLRDSTTRWIASTRPAHGGRRRCSLPWRARSEGRRAGKEFDCIVGVSGGCDSSYLLHRMVELGLRPLAVHFDNTWNSPIATQNIYTVLEHLGRRARDVRRRQRGVRRHLPRVHACRASRTSRRPTDIGFTAVLYRAAEKHGIRYIIEGHSFRTEGVAPLGWIYMDGRYIQSVHDRFGTRADGDVPEHAGSRTSSAGRRCSGIKRLRPLYYMDYQKGRGQAVPADEFGWKWYGGHHLENRFTAFFHTYFLPRRYGIDARQLGHAALVA